MGDSSDTGALTVGQRLTRIEGRLDTIIGGMERLAEEADLRALTARVDLLERDGSTHARRAEAEVVALTSRVQKLETEDAVAIAMRSSRRWIVGLVLGMAGWGSVLVAAVAVLQHH